MILKTGRMMPKRPSEGFTLIELIIVASLVLVLAVISIPLFKTAYKSLRLRDSACNVAKVIRYAQASAVMQEKSYKVMFDFDKNVYWVSAEDGNDSERESEELQKGYLRKFFLPKDLSFSGDKNEIVFLPSGRSAKAVISIWDKAEGKGFNIKVNGKAYCIEVIDVKEK